MPRRPQLYSLTIGSLANPLLGDALAVLQNTRSSVESFHLAFLAYREGARGVTSDEEQDLLRAMLVFASAGLDATVKQLIEDCLAEVINRNDNAQREFQKFLERKISRTEDAESDVSRFAFGGKFIAKILASPEPRRAALGEVVIDLCSTSLQSTDKLLRAASHFAITQSELLAQPEPLNKAFRARNEVAHEMDIQFTANRSRRARSQNEMMGYTNTILKVAEGFIRQVQTRLT